MTFREKLQKEHPNAIDDYWQGGCCACPKSYGYELYNESLCYARDVRTIEDLCRECWNRTIPGTEETKTFDFKTDDIHKLIDRAATQKDISLTIFIGEAGTHISVYPYSEDESNSNPVLEAYKLLVANRDSIRARDAAIKKLEEALK